MKFYSALPRTYTLLMLTLALLANSPLLAQKRNTLRKARPTLNVSNSVSKIRVVFDQPAFINKPFVQSAWRRITIYLPDKTTKVIKTNNDMDGYMYDTDESKLWSPDGQLLAVWLVYGILSKEKFSGMRITFIDLKKGAEADSIVEDGFSTTSYGFKAWQPKR